MRLPHGSMHGSPTIGGISRSLPRPECESPTARAVPWGLNPAPARGSELLEQVVAARDLDRAGLLFDIELLHHAVVDQHRVTARADAHTACREVGIEADRLGEIGTAVGEE